jgi:hypothetical protein
MTERIHRENVTIVSWPEQPAKVEHQFKMEKPCPVLISIEKEPLNVDMNMKLSAREPIPVCIKLCEPICAKSEYAIGIEIFDKPFAGITIRGMTRFFSCPDETGTSTTTTTTKPALTHM